MSVYKPNIQINFGKENKFHVYHCENGEKFITNLTRLNMLFIAGNSILLLLEMLSPCNNHNFYTLQFLVIGMVFHFR